ncbi:hypothetical protein FQN52_004041 [Onygenales sp. PD_12]|nr:hypothetical protein FQN52_004041 [Onygenales sp. PD_12]KAK2802144.1 hypothetical protein FQN51_004825 [Onygenales sp. PD_10]
MRALGYLLPSLIFLSSSSLGAPFPISDPSVVNIGVTVADQDKGSSLFSPPSQSPITRGSHRGSHSFRQSPITRQLDLLKDIDLNYTSKKELRKIFLWLQENWPSAEDLIHSIQALIDTPPPPSSELESDIPSTTTYDEPLPTTLLMQLEDQAGSLDSISYYRPDPVSTPGFSKSFKPPIGVLLGSGRDIYLSQRPNPDLSSDPTSVFSDPSEKPNLFSILCAMDSVALVDWATGSAACTALLVIAALAVLFLISVLIVEAWNLLWKGVIWCTRSWRSVRLSGPEKRLIAAHDEDSGDDGEGGEKGRR